MTIPKEVKHIISELKKAKYEAYIVGGSVRDFLLGKEPKDWDITTNATPEQIQAIFPDSFYENTFLTVTVKTGSEEVKEVEVTTYRSESRYSDKRHPDEVAFAKSLQEDLARRDFTVNAIAMDDDKEIIDPFDGQKDLQKKIIRTVGDAKERFAEDALRMLRAVRFATVLNFEIEEKTKEAIRENSVWIEAISRERVRDELVKMILSDRAAQGIELLRELNLLKFILPELLENYGVTQNKHHIYDCYQHALKALEYATKKKFDLPVRLASLFHDIGKPRVKSGDGKESTFYNHEVVGATMAFKLLQRLKFSNKDIEKIVTLIRYHMFYYNVEEVTESSVRRLIKNVGPENMEALLQVREADRIGSGVPKAEPYKLRHLKYIIDKVSTDPISVGMLCLNGKDVMEILHIQPGPKIGQILDILLGYVLDDPKKNTKELLTAEVLMLGKLAEKELVELAEKSKEEKFEVQAKEDENIKKKYWVA
jgi:poly(A) polymerase/tRNA nucleotidyltransferase (CCA-adding enzyme)